MSQVTVLAPNFRRQTVRVTPNTTMLEIIEEVCKKQGLCADEYNLRHHRSILTPSSTIRFCGIPQNGHLELVEAPFRRKESDVTLCLQLESGERKQGDCLPSESLWDVMTRIAPETSELANPVIIYMRREVAGKEALMETSLRTIGLTEGRAIIRIFNRTVEELRTQANVSAPLTKPPPPPEVPDEEYKKATAPDNDSSNPVENKLETSSKIPEVYSEMTASTENPSNDEKNIANELNKTAAADKPIEITTEINNILGNSAIEKKTIKTEEAVLSTLSDQEESSRALEIGKTEQIDMEHSSQLPESESKSRVDKMGASNQEKMDEVPSFEAVPSAVEKVILLGDRNAIAYSLDSAAPSEPEDLPDDFFELTLEDVRSLYAARRAAVEELNNAPMLTAEQRKLDRDGLILQKLSQYKSCVIRIRMPDRTVLQGCFKPYDTIRSVKEFVTEYLADKDLDFYLYTSPPKEILNEELKLIEADFVPSANFYLGFSSPADYSGPFLRPDVIEKFSSPISASRIALESRGPLPAKVTKPSVSRKTQLASSATSGASSSSTDSPPQKMPKWLKIGK